MKIVGPLLKADFSDWEKSRNKEKDSFCSRFFIHIIIQSKEVGRLGH